MRTAFANDPLNLHATDGPTNTQKGDGDAATWLPPNEGFACEYGMVTARPAKVSWMNGRAWLLLRDSHRNRLAGA